MGIKVLEDITPNSGEFCKSQRHIGYNFFEAVCDLVDNSLSASASRIDLFIEPTSIDLPFVIIDNGHGMDESELISAFKLGRNEEKTEHGRFGFGLKTASISQAKILEVFSLRNGSLSSRKMDLNYFESTGKWNLLAADDHIRIRQIFNELQSGTAVIWREWDFYDKDLVDVNLLIKYLGVVYNKLISSSFSIYVNDVYVSSISVIPEESRLLEERTEGSFSFRIYLIKHPKYWPQDYNQLNEFNSYRLFNDSHKDCQGVYIYRNDRLISVNPQWHGIIMNKSNNFSLSRIEFFYYNDDKNFELDVRHSQVRLPQYVKDVFLQYAKVIKRYSAKKNIEGFRPSSIRINDDQIWNMISHRDGEISFEINVENNFINYCLKNQGDSVIKLMLKKIARELPIEMILSRQERYFAEDIVDEEYFSDLRDIYKRLYPNYSDEEISKLL